jgi:hypothetical protein
MATPTVVVTDDFYEDAARVRGFALRDEVWQGAVGPPDGRYSWETMGGYAPSGTAAGFAALLGCGISYDPRTMGFGVFAFYPGSTRVQETTHYDDTDYSAIVYLCEPRSTHDGLMFFRHRPTGLFGPPSPADLARLGVTRAEFEETYRADKLRAGAWELVDVVSVQFNRCVVLAGGKLFHRAGRGFGSTPADGRLTQRFFFNLGGRPDDA